MTRALQTRRIKNVKDQNIKVLSTKTQLKAYYCPL